MSRLGLSKGIERVVKGRAFLVMKDNVPLPPHGLWFSVTLAYCYVKQLNFRESMIEGLCSGQASTNSLD